MIKHLIYEQKFLKNIKQYVDAYEILINSDCKKEAYSYALCFYASLLGFLHTIYSNDRIVNTMTLQQLSIDLGIIHDLNNFIYSENIGYDRDSNSVYYCYNEATKIPYKHINYMIDSLFILHARIAIASKISTDEKENIENTKNLIYSIKPSLKNNKN